MHCARCARGFEGGALGPPLGGEGGNIPPAWGFRGSTPEKKKIFLGKRVTYLGGFSAHDFLSMVFYFQLRN
jgi:hypothetical protein